MTNLNTKETVTRANNVLKEYRKAKRIAPDEIDFKYKSRSEIGSLGLCALEQLAYIDEAISSLKKEQEEIIIMRYVQKEEIADIEIYYALGYSEATYYRKLKIALVKFAETYKAGELLVFK